MVREGIPGFKRYGYPSEHRKRFTHFLKICGCSVGAGRDFSLGKKKGLAEILLSL